MSNCAFASESTLFVSTDALPRLQVVVAVDPHRSRLHRPRNPVCASAIAGPQASGEPIDRVVDLRYHVVFIVPDEDVGDGTEDLFLGDLHVVADVGKERGLNEQSVFEPVDPRRFATDEEVGALAL